MAETEIITMDARSEITYEFDEDFAPIGISDAADGTGTPWSAVMQQLAKMEQQVAALTQKSRAWDSVSHRLDALSVRTFGKDNNACELDFDLPSGKFSRVFFPAGGDNMLSVVIVDSLPS